ncbi:MAG: UDP-N-acetylmuramoyl-L-alanine--D-glutamate ligase [Dehalococcoidia bacterium]|nr:UDP-N-acetylmuramoyl-L-alanine--D-glutamate ligase [Dehalococcoidia bacterium]
MSQEPRVHGARALVYSMGIEGRDLARWLIAHGANVTMSDTRSPEKLEAAGATPPDGVRDIVTGRELLEPDGFDLVGVAQSVLRHDPAIRRARSLGIPVISQMQLFLQLCTGRTVGITGSSGKSTTTSLVARMAEAAGHQMVMGGNIGRPLLERLEDIGPSTTVVVEISHTQLQYTDRSPRIAAVTNVTPNHLDQFSWDEYVGLKRNILEHQTHDDTAVLNDDDSTSRSLVGSVHGRLFRASAAHYVGNDGAWLEGNQVFAARGHNQSMVCEREEIPLRGEHNVANVVMAAAIGAAMGLPAEAMGAAIREFRGVPHRLETVGQADGVTYINDSIATAPERTIAGLQAIREPVVLLLGGREKQLPLEGLVDEARTRCRANRLLRRVGTAVPPGDGGCRAGIAPGGLAGGRRHCGARSRDPRGRGAPCARRDGIRRLRQLRGARSALPGARASAPRLPGGGVMAAKPQGGVPGRPGGPNMLLVALTVTLAVSGIVAVYSSSFVIALARFGDPNYYIIRHVAWALLGAGLLIVAARTDYRLWRPLALPMMLATIAALVAVVLVGQAAGGAQRWIGVGELSVQPAEFAKFTVIVYMAAWLSSKGDRIRSLEHGLVPFVLIIGIVALLVMMQPNIQNSDASWSSRSRCSGRRRRRSPRVEPGRRRPGRDGQPWRSRRATG